ncbi:unnamed protein product [Chironomus riparius]|uniref:Ionotropic glutamate receptor C-terminal domain-containing protein n=1 Tax=Chironomus riparius TaxID=315576 RepID=A0A9N9WPI4_9DIPT|nr:unnamed protein product [Chironomus riparius]
MQWKSKLQNHEKYLEYYGCELVMLLPVQQESNAITHVSGFAIVAGNLKNFKVHGISPVIFEIAAKYHNYTFAYQPASMPSSWLTKTREDGVPLIQINDTVKDPHVYFEISTLQKKNYELTISKVVANLNVNIFVTPAEKYTPYEKLLLPFDSSTWIFSILTFLATFLSILVINNLPKSTQSIVYGHKVDTPIWNVISIFFGISQTKLPNKNFSRFILMLFIYFCLIFRTCFQSKCFEFMTSEPREPPPKTIEDVIEKNYTVYAMDEMKYLVTNKDRMTKWPLILLMSPNSYEKAYNLQSQNSSAKIALVVDEFFTMFSSVKFQNMTQNWNQLKDTVVYSFHDSFVFIGNTFYVRMLDKIIDRFIPTGIMNHLIENYYIKKLKFETIQMKPEILSLDDLAFGFNIWLCACLVSVFGFIVEKVSAMKSRQMKSFAKVHPINLESKDEICIDQVTTYEITNKVNPQLIGKFRSIAPTISKILHEIADEFILKENNEFSIINYQVNSLLLRDVSTKFMRHHNHPLKYFAFIRFLYFDELKRLSIPFFNRKISSFKTFLYQYTYFITDEDDSIILSTIEWFGPHGCDRPHVYIINKFYKTTLRWDKKLENHEKFMNYHGCELVMLLPTHFEDNSMTHLSGFSIIRDNVKSFDIYGITPEIFKIAAKKHNYKAGYQPASMPSAWLRQNILGEVQLIRINGTLKDPHVFFEISTLHALHNELTSTKIVKNFDVHVFVTPAEKYTPYEKLFLPFDLLTWTFVLITFIATFLIIIIINNLPKSTQTIVYGHKVETPIWNVISIFFGISLIRLPNKNFSRFILLIFIYFCLIFRTCFQSKFFEFMTSEPRRPPPKSIDDIIEKVYLVYIMNLSKYILHDGLKLNEWPVFEMSPNQFNYAYLSQSQNSTAKFALVVDQFFINFLDKQLKRRSQTWNKLENTVIFTFYDLFIFYGTSFYFRMYDKVIDNLIPTGIMNHLIENHYSRELKYEEIKGKPQMLTLEELAFGFNIWFGFCVISIISFIAEYAVIFVKNTITKIRLCLINNKVHPLNQIAENEICIDQITTYEILNGINQELVKHFRISKLTQVDIGNDSTQAETNEDIEIINLEI